MLCNLSDEDKIKLKKEIADWQALVIDTYEELKKETSLNTDENMTPMQKELQRPSIALPKDQMGAEVNKIMRMDSNIQNENPFANTKDGFIPQLSGSDAVAMNFSPGKSDSTKSSK